MTALRVEMAFFDEDELLAHTKVLLRDEEEVYEILCDRGDKFVVKPRFEESACPIFLKYFDRDGNFAGKSAIRMGVDNSEDWESIQLAEPYQLCFKAAIVDCQNPNWATCDPLPDH